MVYWKSILLLCLGFVWDSNARGKPNVCKSWEDYDKLSTSPNCWNNPIINSNTSDIIQRVGYSYEDYEVETEDGYYLTLFRIVKKESNNVDKQPVLMMHGMLTESSFWVALPNRSLAYTLVEDDYDVWLGNFRGNRYGRKHARFDYENTTDFWDFSMDEMAKYDLPAIIATVRNNTNPESKMIYIGHSMGTTAVFMYASENPKAAEENFVGIVALSPSAYLKDMTYAKFLIPMFYPVSIRLEKNLSKLRISKSLVDPSFSKSLFNFCLSSTGRIKTCFYVTQLMFGFDEEQSLPEDFPVLLSYGFSGTSIKCIAHYLQMAGSKKFQHYDHGHAENRHRYNQSKPLEYKLSAITVPVHLFGGSNDALTTYKNVHKMYKDLTCEKSLTMISEDGRYHFNHVDFVVAKDLKEAFIKPMMHLLNEKLLNNKIK